jgi:pimeloyl-ACP methyl ester carboxylesterase
MKQRRFLALLLSLIVFVSCSDDEGESPEPQSSNLVSATLLDTRTFEELQLLVEFSGQDIDPALFKYDVKVFRVEYTTTYREEEIVASGIVALPSTSDPTPMMSFQRGTIVAHNEAPSVQDENSFDVILYGAMASAGYIVVIPDLIGFGSSTEVLHPYYVEEPTARAVVDNITAAVAVARDNNVNFDERLFIAGYSQGGYATLAAHKALEQNPVEGIDVVASFPAAGGYDLNAMQNYFFSLDQYSSPYYLAYVARAYQTYYDYPNIVTDIFNEPYATRIPTLFNGNNSGSAINGQLSTSISTLIREDIRLNFATSTQYNYLREAFEENSLPDWTPEKPIYFYHGTADTTVPYENSVITYEKLIANGASSATVTLTPLPDADHSSGIQPYIELLIEKITELR